MSFISVGFFIVILTTAIIYYILPKKIRWTILLIMSLAFYAISSVKGLLYVGFTIITSYLATRLMQKSTDKKTRKKYLIWCLVCNFGILVFLKYCNFAITNFSLFMSLFHVNIPDNHISIVMPLGISFYTFQTMSYVIDVYEKKYEPEKNIFKFALFVSFLPQMLQGPIGRFDRLSPQLINGNDFDIKNVEYGLQRIAWGLAKKLILADRASVIQTAIFNSLDVYSGVHIIVALLTFSIYEYCDFSGGIDVVIGAAEIFGVKLDENFRQPYFSKSIGEFWRRWHITLGTWMKDYVFYPFSISKHMLKFGKKARKVFGKKIGKVLPICVANILIFFIVGVWHGAQWKYIIYGMYNGIIIAVSNLLKPYYEVWAKKCHINTQSRIWKLFQIIRTFILVNIGWLFDACSTATLSFKAMARTFYQFNLSVLTDGSILKMGLNMRDWYILIIAVIILFITSVMKEKGINLRDFVAEKPLVVRWLIYLCLVFSTAPFGYVGTTTEFMYAQF